MGADKKGRNGGDRATPITSAERHPKPPIVTGQCREVLNLIRQYQPVLSFVLTADHAIPEAAARVHDLRAKGFNIRTQIVPTVEFRGCIRRNAALYSLGSPEWPAPGFFAGEEGGGMSTNNGDRMSAPLEVRL